MRPSLRFVGDTDIGHAIAGNGKSAA